MLLTFLALTAAIAAGAAERDVERTFTVQPGARLKIDSYRGSVIIAESDEPKITVAVHMEIGADNEEEAERMVAGLQLDFKQDGNSVEILARRPAETRFRWRWDDKKLIDLTFRVSVPRQCDLDLKAIFGSFTVGNLAGNVRAQLETGNVFFRTITGNVDVKVLSGEVIVSRCTGALTAEVQQGLIRLGTLGGAAKLKNQSGDIEVQTARGPIEATATAGNLTVGFPNKIGGPAQLTSAAGNVVVSIDPAASCRVEAVSSWGKVFNRLLPLKIESGANGERRLSGRVNDGTTPLVLKASGGSVRIEQGETLFD